MKQVKKENAIKGYKVTDSEMKCINFLYELNKEYHENNIVLCKSGFHFCEKAVDCFNYYNFDSDNRVFEVIGWGEMDIDLDKYVCSDIQFIKEISWNEVLNLINTGKNNTGYSNSGNSNSGNWNSGYSNSGYSNSGYRNSGNSNSGYRNSGNRNSGYRNSGNRNSGNSNSGNWNSINYESGDFNSKQFQSIRVFNKLCNRERWGNASKPDFIYNININEWIYWNNMTDAEKEDNKNAYITEGYLKTYTYEEAWQNAFDNATERDIELLKNLPNFSAKVFEEITGIKLTE